MSTVPGQRAFFSSLHMAGIVVSHALRALVGLVSLLIGVLLTMTLVLAPVGLPLAVMGLVLLASVGQPTDAIDD